MVSNRLLTPIILIFLFSSCINDKLVFDVLIENGTVYNGIEPIPTKTAIGIKGDTISFIGSLDAINYSATRIINAEGMIVCPGFIDPHTHADKDLLDAKTSDNLPFLTQGITTVAIGNDGNSLFPIAKYSPIFKRNGIGTNVVMFTGHGTIRKEVMGESDRQPTEHELDQMQLLLQKEMDEGAVGISTGLFYKPGSYSQTDEVISLAKVVAKNNGVYDTHLRDEGTFSIGLIPAIKEAIEIGKTANLPVHISHIKCLGVDVWHKSQEIISLIEESRSKGIAISANQYPYEASATSLQAAVVPRWAESGGKDSLFIRFDSLNLADGILEGTRKNIMRRGGPDNLLFVRAEDTSLVGKTLTQVAEQVNLSPESAVIEVLRHNSIKVASFNMNEMDITNFMRQEWVVTGSDGGSGHPRKYGSFPRKLRKYVREDSIISLAQFIRSSTYKTAQILQLPKRGALKEGYAADIIVFDPTTFRDNANYTNAYLHSSGLKYTILNGKLSIDQEQITTIRNGIVLHRKEP